ncbi:4'-phosphopantetheinyl transferase family protein [Streptomyces prasinus]|uniref:4'-phosphopantetheinyl transferase family protein n=1 Tax=Streptomyces prasinus TaxID=67345 RepID=UPI0033BB96CB
MIERILPSGVATAVAYGDPDTPDGLLPEEEAHIRRAVPARRQEYATARRCARGALADLGLPPVPLPTGPSGAPRWPDGITGSITHCRGYRAAAVARTTGTAALGIDAERHLPLPEGGLKVIAHDEELRSLTRLERAHPGIRWDTLLFSAKEAVYKAWFPRFPRKLSFRDASLAFRTGPAGTSGTFTARLLVPDSPYRRFEGRWIVAEGLVATAVHLAAPSPGDADRRPGHAGGVVRPLACPTGTPFARGDSAKRLDAPLPNQDRTEAALPAIGAAEERGRSWGASGPA